MILSLWSQSRRLTYPITTNRSLLRCFQPSLGQLSASELPSQTPVPSGYSTLLSHSLTTWLLCIFLTQFALLDSCVSLEVNSFIEKALGLRTSSVLKLPWCLLGSVELPPPGSVYSFTPHVLPHSGVALVIFLFCCICPCQSLMKYKMFRTLKHPLPYC